MKKPRYMPRKAEGFFTLRNPEMDYLLCVRYKKNGLLEYAAIDYDTTIRTGISELSKEWDMKRILENGWKHCFNNYVTLCKPEM